MKMAAPLRLLGWIAWAALAAGQEASPTASDAAGSLPVPKGWHIVAFTSPQAAGLPPAGGGATSLDKSEAASHEEPPWNEVTGTLKRLTAEQEAEASARAAKEVPPDAGKMLADALGSVRAAPAEPQQAEEAEPQPAAQAASSESLDGMQIPPGYRIEGYTPAAAADAKSTPVKSPHPPSPPLAAADTSPMPVESPPPPPLAPTPTAQVPDAMPAKGSDASQQEVPAGNAAGASAAELKASPQEVPTSGAAGASAPELKVDGLQVPAGWKITAVLDDAASTDNPTTVAHVAQKESKADVKLVPPPAVPAAAISITAAQRAYVKKARTPAVSDVSTVAAPVASMRAAAAAVAAPAQTDVAAASTGVPPMPVAAATMTPPVGTEMARPKAADSASWPEASDDDGGMSGMSGVEPVAEEAAAAMAEMGNTAEAAMMKMVNYVRGKQDTESARHNHLPAAAAIGHITSVECLTETINNGGRPCSPEEPKVQPTPAPRRRLLTKGKAHQLKSITQVVPASAPPTEIRKRLRARPAPSVAEVSAKDAEPVAHMAVHVIRHERHAQHEQQAAQAPLDDHRSTSSHVLQAASMADLVSQPDAV